MVRKKTRMVATGCRGPVQICVNVAAGPARDRRESGA